MSDGAAATGYLSSAYVEALSAFGTPRRLPRSGGWLLERPISGTSLRDAMGTYPLLALSDWSRLSDDLEEVGGDLVSAVGVTDPFGRFREEDLCCAFPDLVVPFKDHFIVDLGAAPETFVATHHQRNARKALAAVEVAVVAPEDLADRWVALYSNLIARHGIRGFAAFSPDSLRRQLRVPGTAVFCAFKEGALVGATIWYVQGEAAYYHLGAYSDDGYALRASFALFWTALRHFAEAGLRRLDLGAGAGLAIDGDDGLSRFKRGWSTGTLRAFLCGRILDRNAYTALSEARALGVADYFPAYRKGEFG